MVDILGFLQNCSWICLCDYDVSVVMIIGPVFTIVTQSQVETAWVSIAAVRDAILEPDGGGQGLGFESGCNHQPVP